MRPILMDIYTAAGGGFATTANGWDGTGDWCDWDYVACDSNKEITSLAISNFNAALSGSISDRIVELTKLRTLNLCKWLGHCNY